MDARHRPPLLPGIVLVLTLLLAGCAVQGPEPGPGQLAVIADRTTQAGTARTAMTMEWDMAGFTTEMRMEGVIDTATEALQARIEVQARGPGVLPQVAGELITIDGSMYQSGELARQSHPDLANLEDGHWVRQPIPEQMSGGPMPGMPDQSSPMAFIDQLAAFGGDITTVGRDQVRDTQTTHWRIETTYDRMLQAQSSEEMRQHMEEALAQAPADMLRSPVVIDLWADDDDLVRRMRMGLDLSAAMAGLSPGGQPGEASMRYDMELYDYGVDVTISAPPADRVVEMPDWPAEMGFDAEPSREPGVMQDSAAGLGIGSSFLPGPSPEGLPSGLPPLPYPEGAELVGATSEEVHYLVRADAEAASGELARFHELYLPQYGWSVISHGASGTADSTGATEHATLLEFSGYERDGTVEIADPGTGVLEVTVTFRPSD